MSKPKTGGRAGRAPARQPIPPAPPAMPRVTAETRALPIDAIDWSRAIRDVQRDHVGRLSGAATLPSVVVWEFEKDKFRGVDGFHRWYLAKVRGDKTLQASIRHYPFGPVGERQFEFDCVQLNIEHGLPLTREERNRAIKRLWNRWGQGSSRLRAVSMDQLAKTFNLTRQRIQQIVTSDRSAEKAFVLTARPELRQPMGASIVPLRHDARPTPACYTDARRFDVTASNARTSGYSNLGRFTAAAKRLSSVLGDAPLMQGLLQEHRGELQVSLRQLRDLIDKFLAAHVEPHIGSGERRQMPGRSAGFM